MTVNRIRIEQEIPDQPDAERLFRAADTRSATLYPGESRAGPTTEALLAANIRFFVARNAGQAIGCGGYVPATPDAAELKRLFTDPAHRGQGIATLLLAAIEDLARNERFHLMRLETGHRATEALRLYTRLGYATRPPYGEHAADPSSIFMEKSLGTEPQTR